MDDYQNYIAISRYARYIPEKKRRETWPETVKRYVDYFAEKFPDIYPKQEIYDAIINMEDMPSMRSLMTAGKALDRDNAAGYNCSAMPVDDPRVFDECIYLSMCGVGVGFSVERQFINKLPSVAEEFHDTQTTIKVADSKIGWSAALRELVSLLFSGQVPSWDLSMLRPAGAPLKTFGGRSSGPEPLDRLFKFFVATFKSAAGRKLTSIECHDLMCKIGEIVVVGGVRRSALISLSNLSDDRMRHAKSGQWWIDNPQRALSNNSTAYSEKPDMLQFMKEWKALYESKSGERGIFNRSAVQRKTKKIARRKWENVDFLTNPCVSGDMFVQLKIKDREEYYNITVAEAVDMFNSGTEFLIKSKDSVTNEVSYKTVTAAALTRESAEVLEIVYDESKDPLICTPDHKVMTKNRGWVEAKDLLETDELDIM